MIGRLKKYIAFQIAAKNKAEFSINISYLISNLPKTPVKNIELVSYSGSKYFLDQLLSIFSFYYNYGIPEKWIIFSDGTYTNEEVDIFKSIKNVEIKHFDFGFLPLSITSQFDKFPTLKKLYIFSNINIISTTIFIDSDIIFYQSCKKYLNDISNDNFYIEDESNYYFDEEYLKTNSNIQHPLNLGMIILNTRPDWNVALDYLQKKIYSNELDYWSDQTAMHILATDPTLKFVPLNKYKFVVGGNDNFKICHSCDYSSIAVRHFVGPIRHKMWQYSWKKVLGL